MNFIFYSCFKYSINCSSLSLLAPLGQSRTHQYLSDVKFIFFHSSTWQSICYPYLPLPPGNPTQEWSPQWYLPAFTANWDLVQYIHNAVIEDFGDPRFDGSPGETQPQDIEFQDTHSHHTEAVVDLEEFSLATGISGQQAGWVASGRQQVPWVWSC